MIWQKLLGKVYDEATDREDFIQRASSQLFKYGFFVGLQHKCWCEGMAIGIEHTPGCPGIEQDKLLESLQ